MATNAPSRADAQLAAVHARLLEARAKADALTREALAVPWREPKPAQRELDRLEADRIAAYNRVSVLEHDLEAAEAERDTAHAAEYAEAFRQAAVERRQLAKDAGALVGQYRAAVEQVLAIAAALRELENQDDDLAIRQRAMNQQGRPIPATLRGLVPFGFCATYQGLDAASIARDLASATAAIAAAEKDRT